MPSGLSRCARSDTNVVIAVSVGDNRGPEFVKLLFNLLNHS
jgi:hypothetical protein